MAAWNRCSSQRKHSSLQVPLQALRRFSPYLQLIFPFVINLFAVLFFFWHVKYSLSCVCLMLKIFVLLFVRHVYKNHGAWHWEIDLFLECESWGFPLCTYLSNKFLPQKVFEKSHKGKLPWKQTKKIVHFYSWVIIREG